MFKQNILDAEIIKNKRHEIFKFFNLFVFLFSVLFATNNQAPFIMSSAGNVEQWMNLTLNLFSDSQDFLFSYGPLYWLVGGAPAQYSELTYWLAVAFTSAYSAASWSIIIMLAMKRSATIIIAIMFLFGVASLYSSVVYLTLPFFIVIYCHDINSKRWMDNKLIMVSLAAFVAFLFYVRFFYGMVTLLTFGSYLFSSQVLKRKYTQIVILTIATVFFYIIFGFLIFNNHESILDYLAVNSQLSFGNSVDMNYDVSINQTTYVIVALILICFNIFLCKRQPLLLLTVNGLLLIFFKLGFSRADHYIGYFIYPVALMSLLFVLGRNRLWMAMAILVLGLTISLGKISIYPNSQILAGLKTHEDFTQSYADRAAARYPQYKLPANIIALVGQDSIDVYPYFNEYVIANKLNYRHRPSFQNYMTLTPVLDKLNADFFASNQAPKFVLWTGGITCNNANCEAFNDFDEKYSLNEDPITTTAILSYYSPVGTFLDLNNRPITLMKREPHSEMVKPREMSKITLRFGEWVKVPNLSSGVVKLTPKLNLTLLAKIQNMLYRGEVLHVSYKLVSGEIKKYRLNIINAQSGIWVSPWLNELPKKGVQVTEMMLTTQSQHYFKDGFEATWHEYPIGNFDIKKPVVMDDMPATLHHTTSSCSANIDSITMHQNKLDGRIQTILTSHGWVVYSVDREILPERAWLTLTNGNGNRFYAPLDIVQRPDVAKYFKKPSLARSGYQIMADITGFEGNHQVGLLIAAEGKTLQCSNIAKPLPLQ